MQLPDIPFIGMLLILFVVLIAGGLVLFWRESVFNDRLENQRRYFEQELIKVREDNLRLQGQFEALLTLKEGGVSIKQSGGTLEVGHNLGGRDVMDKR